METGVLWKFLNFNSFKISKFHPNYVNKYYEVCVLCESSPCRNRLKICAEKVFEPKFYYKHYLPMKKILFDAKASF